MIEREWSPQATSQRYSLGSCWHICARSRFDLEINNSFSWLKINAVNTTLVYDVGYSMNESIKGIYSAILGYLFFHNHITDERTFDADAKALSMNVCY